MSNLVKSMAINAIAKAAILIGEIKEEEPDKSTFQDQILLLLKEAKALIKLWKT